MSKVMEKIAQVELEKLAQEYIEEMSKEAISVGLAGKAAGMRAGRAAKEVMNTGSASAKTVKKLGLHDRKAKSLGFTNSMSDLKSKKKLKYLKGVYNGSEKELNK